MKTLFPMFAVIGTLLLVSCSKEENPRNNPSQRPDISNNETDVVPVSVKVINDYPEAEIVRVFINSNELFEVSGDIENHDGKIHTTALAGKNTVKVILSASNGGSVVVIDSGGTAFCQNVESGIEVEVGFEDIEMKAEKDIIIKFLSGACSGS